MSFQGYRPDIDGLRAVSILAVVLYHVRLPGFESGYLGVDVFFVISGFLITGQLLREARTTGSIEMGRFYARRVRRLLPAFAAMAIGTSVLALLYLLPMDEQSLFSNALTRSALFYYNIAVWRGGYDYAAVDAQQRVLMHTWSLGVEEQFYLTWPWICLIVVRIGRPFAAFSAVVAASLIGAWWTLPRDPGAVFFLLPFRAWELGLGACVAARPCPSSLRIAGAGTLAGAGLVGFVLLSRESLGTSLWPALLVSMGTALITAFGAAPNPASSFLRTSPMVNLGRMSYAWYLWHWPLLVIARLVTVFEEPMVQAGALAASFVLAALTFLWIERPARRLRIANPRPMLAWGVVGITAIVLMGRAIEFRNEMWMAEPQNAAKISRLKGRPIRPCEKDFATLGCDISAKPAGGEPSLLLWGDSFAWALSPALSEYSRVSGANARLLFENSCPPLLGVVPGGPRDPAKPNRACQDALRSLQTQLPRERSRISGVVLAARWPLHVRRDASGEHRGMYEWDGEEIEGSFAISRGLRATLDLMEALELRVLVVGAPPAFPFEVPVCLWRVPTRCSVDRSWNETARQLSRTSIEEAVRGREQVRFVELFDPLCPGRRCSAGTLDEPLLVDRTHLSAIVAQGRVLLILTRHLNWLRRVEGVAARPDRPR